MANKKITDLDELTTPANGDYFETVDVSDLTDGLDGSSRKITLSNIKNFISGDIIRSPYVVVGFDDNCDYICDGTADEVQINLALASLSSTGGTVLLKQGTYNLASSILHNFANVILTGFGWKTYIILSNGANCTAISVNSGGVTKDGQVIRDLLIDGNLSNNTSVSGYEDCIHLNVATNALIENCKLINAVRSGIRIDGGSFNRILNNFIDACGDDSINPYAGIIAGSTDLLIRGNEITNCIKDGIALADTTTRSTVTNNLCINNGQGSDVDTNVGAGGGIYLSPNCNKNIISNNVCNGHKNTGIDLDRNANDNIIIGNRCDGNRQTGILTHCSGSVIIGNHCKSNGTGVGGYLDGINIIGTGTGEGYWNMVQGNWSSGNGGHGFATYGYSDYNVLTGNIFIGNTGTNISLANLNDINQHNIT